MTIRKKRNLIIFVVLPVGGSIFGFLGFVHIAFIILFFLWLIFIGILTKNIKCPKCGTPVGLRKKKIGETEIETYSLFTKDRCDECGYPFDK